MIRLRPDYYQARCHIGRILQAQGDYAGSLAEYRKGHAMAPKNPDGRYPTALWVADAERLAALAERLPSLLSGEDRPKDVAERLGLAKICYDKKRFAASARFLAEALDADPKLGDDRQASHRYNAACAAALASSGQGKDRFTLDDAARAGLRVRALDWLRAELEAWTKALGPGRAGDRAAFSATLGRWQQDADLAGLRDAESLAMLPEAERKAWSAFWAEVEALRRRSLEKSP